MKLIRILSTLAGASLAIAMTLALTLPAQENPAPPPEPPAAPTDTVDSTSTTDDDELRVLGEDVETTAEEPGQNATEVADQIADAIREEIAEGITISVESSTEDGEESKKWERREGRGKAGSPGEIVQFGTDINLPEDGVAQAVVAIMGSAVVDGESRNEVVAIMGNVTINGSVGNETVAVMGDVTINGKVGNEVVAVMGNVYLGPEAVVGGDVVSVGGMVQRAPGSVIEGATNQIQIPFLGAGMADGIKAWAQNCLRYLRPLAFADNLGWLWSIMLAALGFYCLLALMLPDVVNRTAETMEKFPGMSLLTAVLTLVITPIAMLVLSVTVVGPAVLGILLVFVGIFGKVVFFAWMGRRITQPAGWKMPALAVLIGGVITLGIYLVPVLGFFFQKLTGVLGTGIVIYTIILAIQENSNSNGPTPAPAGVPMGGSVPPPPPAPAAAGAAAGAEFSGAAMGGSVVSDSASAPRAAVVPPTVSSSSPGSAVPPVPPQPTPTSPPVQLSTLPRVGFWARFAATLIDMVALGIAVGVLNIGDYFPLVATVYFIVLWALKGTTLGGVVLGIKIVRLDDKPVDWAVALVRSLGGFLSLFIIGLGFVWVAWDPERQSWHDKIAGTTIVKMPKGVSLI